MAQHFEVPVVFEFRPTKLPWQRTTFEIAGPSSAFAPPPPTFPGTEIPIPIVGPKLPQVDHSLIRLTGRVKRSGGPIFEEEALFRAWPRELERYFETTAKRRKSERDASEHTSEIFVSFAQGQPDGRLRDAWTMRSEFLQLPETDDALFAFLAKWGAWSAGKLALQSFPFRLPYLLEDGNRSDCDCIVPSLVWTERKQFRNGLLARPETWLSANAALGFEANRDRFPFLGVKASNCSHAIKVTITLDHLRSVRSRICARPDCDNIFTVESKHGKRYCNQYCAHLVSVRKNRAAAKKAKSREEKGTS